MIVTMLADRKGQSSSRIAKETGPGLPWVEASKRIVFRAFHQGVTGEGRLSVRAADRLREDTPVGLDQLL